MAKSICFFNNKGGVGKTTTSCNVAAGLSQKYRKRVLVVDLDPQCNSTLLILGEERTAEILWDSGVGINTILTVVEPMLMDEPRIEFNNGSIDKEQNRFSVDLVVGHPKLSLIEDRLGESWGKLPGGDIGAIRKTNWFYSLLKKVDQNYDYILVDLGPSLGALNRSALLASDYFVTPMSTDIFSLIGLRNISEWLQDWSEKYDKGISNLMSGAYKDAASKYDIKMSPTVIHGFAGYTTQSYISFRTEADGTKRPTKAFEKILNSFPGELEKCLGGFIKSGLTMSDMLLGQIPNMHSLAPLAQSSSSPVRQLKSSDGIFGQHYSQVEKYASIFDGISQRLLNNVEAAHD